MANIFTNATQARKDTRNNVTVHGEVTSLESKVLANIDSGVLYANVSAIQQWQLVMYITMHGIALLQIPQN